MFSSEMGSLNSSGVVSGTLARSGGFVAWVASRLPPDLEKGAPLPAATLRDAAGKPIDLSSFRGRPVFLDFWTST